MKIIKDGKPYRKHKCSECGGIYIYHKYEDVTIDIIYCPICHNYLDFHWFDKRISKEEYEKIHEVNKLKEDK